MAVSLEALTFTVLSSGHCFFLKLYGSEIIAHAQFSKIVFHNALELYTKDTVDIRLGKVFNALNELLFEIAGLKLVWYKIINITNFVELCRTHYTHPSFFSRVSRLHRLAAWFATPATCSTCPKYKDCIRWRTNSFYSSMICGEWNTVHTRCSPP